MDVDVSALPETFFHFLLLNAIIRFTRILFKGFSSLRDSHPHPDF
jgi:hypothetical protein